jgi:hypothetical protein
LTPCSARLDRIETLLLAKQDERIAALEARMKKLEDALSTHGHDRLCWLIRGTQFSTPWEYASLG